MPGPPPTHNPVNRPYQFAVDVFDPTFRRWEDGSWSETPVALLIELWVTNLRAGDSAGIMSVIRRFLRKEYPDATRQILQNLGSIGQSPIPKEVEREQSRIQ